MRGSANSFSRREPCPLVEENRSQRLVEDSSNFPCPLPEPVLEKEKIGRKKKSKHLPQHFPTVPVNAELRMALLGVS